MGSTKTTLKKLDVDLDIVLKALAGQGEAKATRVVKEATENLFTAIIVGTPVWFDGESEGMARGSWIIQSDSPAGDIRRRKKNKGRNYVRNQLKGFKLTQNWYLSNSVPYINTLEFGGYRKNVRKGSWSKIQKRFEVRSENGFSKQAPEGMVRVNLLRWPRIIVNAIKNRSKRSGDV